MKPVFGKGRTGVLMRLTSILVSGIASVLVCFTSYPTSSFAAGPGERVYEMVSPPYKGGQAVAPGTEALAVAPSGEAAAFRSAGVFAESPTGMTLFNGYFARRTSLGWVTSAADPPATLSTGVIDVILDDHSPDLSRSLSDVQLTASDTTHVFSDKAFYQRAEPEGPFVRTSLMQLPSDGTGIAYETSSTDLSHAVVQTVSPLIPADTSEFQRLYEVPAFGKGTATPRLVGINEAGEVIDPHCPVELGSGSGGSRFHAVSEDGAEIFFTTNVVPSEGTRCDYFGGIQNPGNPAELFMRVDGSTTVKVSRAECTEAPCNEAKEATAIFQGASVDGSKAFFTTTQPMVNADKNAANDLYEARVIAGSVEKIIQVSRPQNPEDAADVQGVVRISDDGSHVYFVAKGVLAGENAEGRQPVSGADNLYVYEAAGDKTKFVAPLITKQELETIAGQYDCVRFLPGGIRRKRCEAEEQEALATIGANLWGLRDEHPAQATPNGRFLVFDTRAPLINSGREADVDSAVDVYRYAAESETLIRVSVGESGSDENGNANIDAEIAVPQFFRSALEDQYEMSARAITDDGKTVAFTTPESLSTQAINGEPDIYVWHEGGVKLVSGGLSPTPDTDPAITPVGRDLFFKTDESLVRQDEDGTGDIYDARIGGGFAPLPTPPAKCVADACQEQPSPPPSLFSAGTITQPPSGNLVPTPPRFNRAERLKRALLACSRKPKTQRKACKLRARRKYGGTSMDTKKARLRKVGSR